MRQKITAIPYCCIILIGFVVGAVALTSCSAEEEQPSPSSSPVVSESKAAAAQNQFRTISGVEAQAMIIQRKDLLVVDVRTPQERAHECGRPFSSPLHSEPGHAIGNLSSQVADPAT